MKLPVHRTKIVGTLGPASRSPRTLSRLVAGGLNVVRLNLSHGTPEQHARDIRLIRSTAARTGRPLSVLIDLPGPKIRIGRLAAEPLVLRRGDQVVLTTRRVPGTADVIPVSYRKLARSVVPGGLIFLNDGFLQLRVLAVRGQDVRCRVMIGGPLLSNKGLNLPGARIFTRSVTARDLELLDFGLDQGVSIFGVSFVERAEDILAVKRHAARRGRTVYAVAKIERIEAVRNLDRILEVADAIMVARGDLGVEIPIEEVPVVQKEVIRKANLAGRPVIIATQMLMSMVDHIRPTRAEVTDVANAILDGTDAVMLSEEMAIGRYPVEAVRMMSAIAGRIEAQRREHRPASAVEQHFREGCARGLLAVEDAISLSAVDALRALGARYILTPTHTGSTPRRISRFKPECWILAFTRVPSVREFLNLSCGVWTFHVTGKVERWTGAMLRVIRRNALVKKGDRVILTEGLQAGSRGGTDSMRVMTVE